MVFMPSSMELVKIGLYYNSESSWFAISIVLVSVLYRIDVLHAWKTKCSPDATYGGLLQVFLEGGFTDCATEMVLILSEDWSTS